MYPYINDTHEGNLYEYTAKGIRRLSQSSIALFLECAFKFYLKYLDDETKIDKTDYPKLCGSLVHRFTYSLYNEHKHPGRFYYKTQQSAIGAWFYYWNKELEINKDRLVKIDVDKAKMFGGVGANCISNYWALNYDKSDPLAREERFSIPWKHGFDFIGVIDQIREITEANIAILRPEIVKDGILDERFDPVVLVDLKTGYIDYEVDPCSTEEAKIKHQQELINNLQAAAYTFLYQKHHNGKLPVCFSIYHLRTNKFFNIVADGESQQCLFIHDVNHVIKNIENRSFPQNKGFHCKRCDYQIACTKKYGYSICTPDESIGTPSYMPQKKEDKHTQLKLKLKYSKK